MSDKLAQQRQIGPTGIERRAAPPQPMPKKTAGEALTEFQKLRAKKAQAKAAQQKARKGR